MHQLTIDGLNYGVLLAANHHLLFKVFHTQRLECVEDALPTALPVSNHIVFGRLRFDHKLHIAIAVRLLSVRREKVGPT